ncbi:acyl-CoA-binding protein (ACBP)/diazepam binding inhibitor (DBI)/endozepine (EP) [Malassezia japonica]|uniref:Acyl-CoA-binding protein (ACBP)/diazepam binding inhibitor (DBI)/endozepine (EP) n=1 Tax=Malassezia japonica TaxID=223818 RepID=A0AAF0EZ91_9BASI|nr:acyl-CoA-binding protein (ACBP)/diazepam binding inhibitor (DBI)/endozepine (EP) [Malassezia japonica]WFD37805.1 acyl-CoA-binding protein (ACBP)/diazepam binding inhibitor (DBI)/endozepine (EP) [Malassezia japonica]
MTLDTQFDTAVNIIKNLPKNGPLKVNQAQQLKVYSLYKQATEGDINTQRPGLLDQTGRYKWDAWNSVKGKSSEDAKKEYVQLFFELFEPVKDDLEYSKHIEAVKNAA